MILQIYTIIHTLISLIAIFTGIVVVFGMLAGAQLKGWTKWFLITAVATTVTGFFFPFHGFTPAIGLGIISLPFLALTIYARYSKRLGGAWRWIYAIGAVICLYFNLFVLVVQAFEKIPVLHAIAPTQTEPPFKLTQLVVLLGSVLLAFVAEHQLDEEDVIAAFLHAARLGIFDMSWNILCPACGGVLDSGATLKTVKQAEYTCVLCAEDCEPTLDEIVEVTFTISPRVRRIAAHNPETLPWIEYYRQIFWSSGVDLPDDDTLAKWVKETTLDALELSAGDKAALSLQLPEGYVIVFDPVLHMSQHIEVKGEPARESQSLSFVMTRDQPPAGPVQMRPGPLQMTLENRSNMRSFPAVWVVSDKVHDLVSKRRPFLTAKRLLTNQTFRDIYRTDALDVDQRLKITSLTFLFTDLKGSTELYERVGVLVAVDLLRYHFLFLFGI